MLLKSGTYIICELSQTHEGDFSLAKKLVKAASEAKADAVKVQVFTADELAVPTYKYYKLFQKLEWSKEIWKDLLDYAHKNNVELLADVFGEDSLDMLSEIGIDGIKIHATDIRNKSLLKKVAEKNISTMLSIGGAEKEEVEQALSILNNSKRETPVILMHGFQSYPTLVEHTKLEKMRFFKDTFRLPVGFADHIDGDHALNFALCSAAIGMGAKVIEKHITIARSLKMEDYESALSPDTFITFVSQMRALDQAMGEYSDSVSSIEMDYRRMTRKHVVALQPIKSGTVISEKDVVLKRSDATNAVPSDLDEVIGKKADKDYVIDEVLIASDLK